MIAPIRTVDAAAVPAAEYLRLLGYPRGHQLEGRALELAEWARHWYAEHGRPWVYGRRADSVAVASPDVVRMEGRPLRSPRLSRTLNRASARDAVLVAVSAGPELEEEARRRWEDGKPDEYFFLEVYGAAVVEYLVTRAGAGLCAWADGQGLAVLPHDSPGYPDWDVADQRALLDLIGQGTGRPLPVEAFESGMLRPKKSLLAVFGLAPQTDDRPRLIDLVPCTRCAHAPCSYRRTPYGGTSRPSSPELTGLAAAGRGREAGLDPAAAYSVSRKALRRWAAERLSLAPGDDGRITATFRYDGTTCTNLGRPLRFLYRITLDSKDERYRIRTQACTPAPGDEGHRAMCRYLTGGAALMADIAGEQPLVGRPLDEVIGWTRPSVSTGCYCESDSRLHKWGLVLETIHFALAHGSADAPESQRTE